MPALSVYFSLGINRIRVIIKNFRYDLSVSHFSAIKKIVVVLGILFFAFSPMLVLVLFGPMTN